MKTIRLATPDDTQAMLEIYAPFILHSGITQETEVPTVIEFQNRITSYLQTYPWLVYEIDGVVIGYAYASQHRSRKGYQWCVEASVYIEKKFSGKGIGKALYNALMEILRLQNYVNVYAVITLPNEASVSFHRKFGFLHQTIFHKIGYKLGEWHDVDWWYYKLTDQLKQPEEPISFSSFDPVLLQHILNKYSSV